MNADFLRIDWIEIDSGGERGIASNDTIAILDLAHLIGLNIIRLINNFNFLPYLTI